MIWEALLERSLQIGADYIATGHYARITKLPNGRYSIRNSVTAAKDQTYALYNLTQQQLASLLGVTRQTIISLENDRYNPSILLAHKIAQIFDARIEDIFIFEEEDA